MVVVVVVEVVCPFALFRFVFAIIPGLKYREAAALVTLEEKRVRLRCRSEDMSVDENIWVHQI